MDSRTFTLLGSYTPGGSYILMISLSAPVNLAFGRFMNGKPIELPDGDYLYIGSALGGIGSHNPLASRLVRHTARSGGKKPHAIREEVIALFAGHTCSRKNSIGIAQKKLRWHIDYLLDLSEAEITHIVVIRSPFRLERKLWELLRPLEETGVPAHRLGAQDTRDSTHLLKLSDRKKVLEILRNSIPAMLIDDCTKEY
ncbi:MAG: DUF123 domain-containing protein [Chlorobiaceae bacterium]|nr:DUF123 domain-containing protein [Chlorobiaceae bacterium]NTV60778.1 DUF123 domain-containing protein [Chlorobiaceae bacterium]